MEAAASVSSASAAAAADPADPADPPVAGQAAPTSLSEPGPNKDTTLKNARKRERRNVKAATDAKVVEKAADGKPATTSQREGEATATAFVEAAKFPTSASASTAAKGLKSKATSKATRTTKSVPATASTNAGTTATVLHGGAATVATKKAATQALPTLTTARAVDEATSTAKANGDDTTEKLKSVMVYATPMTAATTMATQGDDTGTLSFKMEGGNATSSCPASVSLARLVALKAEAARLFMQGADDSGVEDGEISELADHQAGVLTSAEPARCTPEAAAHDVTEEKASVEATTENVLTRPAEELGAEKAPARASSARGAESTPDLTEEKVPIPPADKTPSNDAMTPLCDDEKAPTPNVSVRSAEKTPTPAGTTTLRDKIEAVLREIGAEVKCVHAENDISGAEELLDVVNPMLKVLEAFEKYHVCTVEAPNDVAMREYWKQEGIKRRNALESMPQ